METMLDDFAKVGVLFAIWLQHPNMPYHVGAGLLATWLAYLTVKIRQKEAKAPIITSNEKAIKDVQEENDRRLLELKNREKLKKRILQMIIGQGLDDFSYNTKSPFYLTRAEAQGLREQCAFALGLPGLVPEKKKKLFNKTFKADPVKLPDATSQKPVVEDKTLTKEERLAKLNAA